MLLTELERFSKYITMTNDCWIWTGAKSSSGYGNFRLKSKQVKPHRAMFTLFNGETDKLICHHCDNPLCVNPKHAYVGTYASNRKDCVSRKRNNSPKGENHPKAKLNKAQVSSIRKKYTTGKYTQTGIATMYGVTQGLIGQIVRGKIW